MATMIRKVCILTGAEVERWFTSLQSQGTFAALRTGANR